MKIKVVFAAILLLFILAHPIYGADSVEKEPDFYRYTFRESEPGVSDGLPESELQLFLDEIPSDIASQFGIDGDTGIGIRDSLLADENVGLFFSAALDAVKKQLTPSLETLALILAMLVIGAAFSAMKNSISVSAPGIVPVFDLCSALCIAMALYQTQMKLAQQTADCIERICTLINGALPFMGAIYMAGGNGASAVVTNGMTLLSITILQNICTWGLLPMAQLCFSLALVGAVSGNAAILAVTRILKRMYTMVLVFVMTVLSFVLTYQSVIAETGDNLLVGTIRFAVGSFIPIVGGAVGDALKTVGGGLAVLKNAGGILGIAVIVLMLMPTLLSLVMHKFSIGIGSAAAELFDCSREKTLLDEMNGLCGFYVANVSVAAVFFILVLALFVKCSLAVGGG